MKSPRVLVAAPTYEGKDYCIHEYLEAVRNLDYNNYDHIMVDNTKGNKYARRLRKLGVNAFRVSRGANSRQAINNSMNFIREYFLNSNYDYLLVVESDLFPQRDTIQRLIGHKKAVVGSFYLLGHASDDVPFEKATQLLKHDLITKNVYHEVIKGLQPRRACLFHLDRKEDGQLGTRGVTQKETEMYFRKGLRQVHGCGMGCTLIRRDIMERFSFWTDDRYKSKHHDVYFYVQLHNEGIYAFVDTDVLIEHQPSKWDDVKDR